MLHYGLQQWDVALDWLNKMPMAKDDDLPEIWQMESIYLTASIAMVQGSSETARKTLEKAVRVYPYSTDFLFLLGQVMVQIQDYDNAYAVMQRALEQGEDHVVYGEPGSGSYVCRMELGGIEIKRKHYKEAVKEYMSLLEQYPYYRSAWRALLELVDDHSPRDIVDLLGMVLSKTQMRNYLTRQSFLSPTETKLRDWLEAN
jgi:tetratricopeptide (TPR) repeat protein